MLQTVVSFHFTAHREVRLWLFEVFKVCRFKCSLLSHFGLYLKSFLPTLRAVCDTGSHLKRVVLWPLCTLFMTCIRRNQKKKRKGEKSSSKFELLLNCHFWVMHDFFVCTRSIGHCAIFIFCYQNVNTHLLKEWWIYTRNILYMN